MSFPSGLSKTPISGIPDVYDSELFPVVIPKVTVNGLPISEVVFREPPAGQVKYRLADKNLEMGGFGRIVEDVNDSTIVLKIPHERTKEIAEAFLNEMKIIERLYGKDETKQRIVEWVARFKLRENCWVGVFRKCSGDLLNYVGENLLNLPERTLPVRSLSDLMYQVLDIVAFVNREKILHRDLKLENILFEMIQEKDGTVRTRLRLTDFGHAIELEENQEFFADEKMAGTLHYMSPEVFFKNSEKCSIYSKKSESWAVAALIYRLMTRGRFFVGIESEDLQECYNSIHQELFPYFNPAAPWDGVYYDMDDSNLYYKLRYQVIDPMQKINPNDRITTEEALEKMNRIREADLPMSSPQVNQYGSHKRKLESDLTSPNPNKAHRAKSQ